MLEVHLDRGSRLDVLLEVAEGESVIDLGVDEDVVQDVAVFECEPFDFVDPGGFDVYHHARHRLRCLVGGSCRSLLTTACDEGQRHEQDHERLEHRSRVGDVPVTPPAPDELRSMIDARLDALLDQRMQRLPEAGGLISEIRRVLDAGGKRLRPAFCYWGYRATGAAHSEGIVAVASAFELLHTFAIVHDDIMDSAAERRGQPTTVAHLGPARALLAGDLALVLADAAFWEADLPLEHLAAGFAHFTSMREQVIAGQDMDVEAHRSEVDESRARAIAVLKSGSYSIEHPLLIGARLGGADESLLSGLARFGRPLGEAFQLRDDLLGLFGDPATTGKPADSDIREGKRNVLFAKALASSTGEDRDTLLRDWGGGSALADDRVEVLRSIVERSGARSATEELIDSLRNEAAAALQAAPIVAPARAELERLAHAAVTRTY